MAYRLLNRGFLLGLILALPLSALLPGMSLPANTPHAAQRTCAGGHITSDWLRRGAGGYF